MKYVYFVCAILHFINMDIIYRNYEYVCNSKPTKISDINRISDNIMEYEKTRDHKEEIGYVSIVNYKLLRIEKDATDDNK